MCSSRNYVQVIVEGPREYEDDGNAVADALDGVLRQLVARVHHRACCRQRERDARQKQQCAHDLLDTMTMSATLCPLYKNLATCEKGSSARLVEAGIEGLLVVLGAAHQEAATCGAWAQISASDCRLVSALMLALRGITAIAKLVPVC